MPKHSIITTLFDIHISQLTHQEEASLYALRELMKDNPSTDPVECSVLTWLMTEHALRFKKNAILQEFNLFISRTIHLIEANWMMPQEHLYLDFSKDVFTSHLAIFYAALMNLRNLGIQPIIQQTATAIRDRIFEEHLKGGMVTCSPTHSYASTDLLLSVLPFGLFSPEDLVMVQAVKEIETQLVNQMGVKASPLSDEHSDLAAALLSWYFLEKGDHAKYKHYRSFEKPSIETASLYGIINHYASNEEENPLITHEPYGHENRYEPLEYERYPRNPTDTDEVFIHFTAPYSAEAATSVHVSSDNCTMAVKANYIQGEKPYWKANIGTFPAHEKVDYYIELIDVDHHFTSPSYSFYPLEKKSICRFEGSKMAEELFQFEAIEEKGLSIVLDCKNKQMLFSKESAQEKGRGITSSLNQLLAEEGFPLLSEDPFIPPVTLLVDRFNHIEDITIHFYSPLQERFFGMGERYHKMEYRGENLDCYVYNQYRDQGARTYMPIPFFISSLNYGLFVNTSAYSRFDFAKSCDDILAISITLTEKESTTFQFFTGKPKEITASFTNLTGPAEMLPVWAFGPWMSSNNWDRDGVVRDQVKKTSDLEIPSTVLVLEQWSDETTYYIFNDAIYEPTDGAKANRYEDYTFPEWGRWPDPKGLVEHINEHGMELILWQIPIMKYLNRRHHPQKDRDEAHMLEKQYYIKNKDNQPYRMPEGWFKESLLMDFSHAEAAKWWFEKRSYLLDIGVAGFKTDGGEMVFGDSIRFADGRLGNEMRNEYPNDYIKAYYEFSQEHRPNNAMTFSRAGYTGAQKYPAHWAGDERSTFDAFKRSLIAGLSSGMSGVIMWGWDLAGFNGDIPTAELFIRSAQMAAFCPIMQYHAESKAEFNQDRTPWNIAERTGDERAISGYRFFANVRMNLLPYIVEQASLSVRNGIPMMRAMMLECPDDPKTFSMFDQYFFGVDLLIAPVIEEGSMKRTVYLPEGKWISLFNKEVFSGKQIIHADAPLMEIPVYQRNNTCVITNVSKEKMSLGSFVGNSTTVYEHAMLHIVGDQSFTYSGVDHLKESWEVEVKVEEEMVKIVVRSSHDSYSITYTNSSEKNVTVEVVGSGVKEVLNGFDTVVFKGENN